MGLEFIAAGGGARASFEPLLRSLLRSPVTFEHTAKSIWRQPRGALKEVQRLRCAGKYRKPMKQTRRARCEGMPAGKTIGSACDHSWCC